MKDKNELMLRGNHFLLVPVSPFQYLYLHAGQAYVLVQYITELRPQ